MKKKLKEGELMRALVTIFWGGKERRGYVCDQSPIAI
jgi:hypothetical protein